MKYILTAAAILGLSGCAHLEPTANQRSLCETVVKATVGTTQPWTMARCLDFTRQVNAKAVGDAFARGVSRGMRRGIDRSLSSSTYRGKIRHSDGTVTRWRTKYRGNTVETRIY